MMTATAAATVAVAVQVAEAIRNVLLETANVQVHIPIIATVVIGKLTNIAPTAAIHQQADATAVRVEEAVRAEAIRNAMMEITNALHLIILGIAQMASGSIMIANTALTAVTTQQEDVKVIPAVQTVEIQAAVAAPAEAVRQNATTVSIVAPIMFRKGVAVENG